MTRICYVDKRFGAASEEAIRQANAIVEEYDGQALTLTLRQLYYQFVSRDLIPNNMREYKRLGSIVNDARLAGRMDWEAIEDRGRNLRSTPHWDSAADFLEQAPDWFAHDLWANQPTRVEAWIEKDALVGVLEGPCRKRRVPFFACRGYNSQSEQWRASRRFRAYERGGQDVLLLHLGDHDPSGIDMTRDNDARLNETFGSRVRVKRIALNFDQVERYDPPPNPAKLTDSRAEGYIRRFGSDSWELDALEPSVIAALVRDEVEAVIDPDLWAEAVGREVETRERVRDFLGGWDE